jgi:hypothetical protein
MFDLDNDFLIVHRHITGGYKMGSFKPVPELSLTFEQAMKDPEFEEYGTQVLEFCKRFIKWWDAHNKDVKRRPKEI